MHDVFGDSLALIRYHGWWPDGSDPFYLANTVDARARVTFLGTHPPGGMYAPHLLVDGRFDAGSEETQYEAFILQALNIPATLTMTLDVDLDFANRMVTVTCDGTPDIPIEAPTYLRVVIAESGLLLPSASSFPFDQVMRDMLPDAGGTLVNMRTGQPFSHQFTASLNPSWEIHNLEFVAFVQADTLAVPVYQTVKATVPRDLPWFRLVGSEATETGSTGDGDGIINPGEDGTIALAVRADPEWGAVTDVTLTLTSLSDLVTVTDGTANLPDMAPGDTVWVPGGQLGVAVSQEADFVSYPMEVAIAGTYGAGKAYVQHIPINLLVSMNQAGFPFATGGEVLSSPAVFPLPASFVPGYAIAVGDEIGNVHVIDSHGQYLQGFPVQAGTRASSSPAVADLDDDGLPEIVIGSWDNHLYCFNIDGSTRWSADLGGYITGPAAIGDVDGDGAPEIAAGTMSGDLWVLEADGSPAQGWPVALGSTQRMSAGVCLADLDADGAREIVVGTWGKNVYAYDGDATPLPGWPVVLTKEVKAGVITTTVAIHGLVVLVPCLDDALHVLKPSGEDVASIVFEGDLMSTPAVTDLDGDGTLEIIATAANGYVHVLDFMLEELPGWPVSVGARVESSPVVADLDADGVPEVVIAADDAMLRVFRIDGTLLMSALDLGSRIRSTPAIGDLDEDNDIDLVVGSGAQIVGLDFKTQGGSVAGMWSQYRAVATKTGDYLDLGAVAGPRSPILPTVVSLRSIQPNPSARQAWVTMDLPRETVARLDVFDAAGRRVGTPVHAGMAAGSHRVAVDVSSLSQGLYFLRLTTEQGGDRRALVVLK